MSIMIMMTMTIILMMAMMMITMMMTGMMMSMVSGCAKQEDGAERRYQVGYERSSALWLQPR